MRTAIGSIGIVSFPKSAVVINVNIVGIWGWWLRDRVRRLSYSSHNMRVHIRFRHHPSEASSPSDLLKCLIKSCKRLMSRKKPEPLVMPSCNFQAILLLLIAESYFVSEVVDDYTLNSQSCPLCKLRPPVAHKSQMKSKRTVVKHLAFTHTVPLNTL